MTLIIAIIGGSIVLAGLVGLLAPAKFRVLLGAMTSRWRFLAAIVLRLGMGLLLWFAADQLRFPHVMRIIAVIAFAAALGVLIMGRERLDKLVDWWLTRPDRLFRFSMFFAGAFGAFLVYITT